MTHPPNYGPHLWERAGRILLVERLRLNTHRVIATLLDEEALGNVWWPLKPKGLSRQQEKVLMLWLNGSLGILLYVGHRIVTQGPWTQMKQPAWQSMPVLDVRKLSPEQITDLSADYDQFSEKPLEPLADLKRDPIRIQIDSAIARRLKLPDLTFVRELLDREPGLTGRDIVTRKNESVEADLPEAGGDSELLV